MAFYQNRFIMEASKKLRELGRMPTVDRNRQPYHRRKIGQVPCLKRRLDARFIPKTPASVNWHGLGETR